MKVRTALINELRGLLSAYGIVLPTSVSEFRTAFVAKLEAERSKLQTRTLRSKVYGRL
jgi:N-methylhydantoinase A/oxoprolinase/acetone carboxylase beta subunit